MAVTRPATIDDLDTLARLFRSVGWAPLTHATWRRLWVDNPALQGAGGRSPAGWVIEHENEIVGFLGNLLQEYRFEGKRLTAAIAVDLVVSPQHRGDVLKLVVEFVRQPDVDLLLNTTATAETSKIFSFFKLERIPQPRYDESLYWILHPRRFAAAAGRRSGWPPSVSGVVGALVSPVLRCERTVRALRRARGANACELRVMTAEEIGPAFNELWESVRQERTLLASRTADTLRWHFANAASASGAGIVAAYSSDRLVGYLALVRRDSAQYRLTRAYVADVFVPGYDPTIIRSLFAAGVRFARAGGADMIEVIGMPEPVRSPLLCWQPRRRQYPSWPFLFRARDPGLHAALSDPHVWHAGLYDGDGSL